MKIDISQIAKLANLDLTFREKKKFSSQLASILEYIGKLKRLKTENIQPTSQVTGLENVTSQDYPRPSISQEIALSGTRNQDNGFFRVKAIFE